MTQYVEGMVAAAPADRREEVSAFCKEAAALFLEFGALRVVDCWGDDVPRGKGNDLYGAVLAKEGEVVLFSWIEYPSKAARDAIWQKIQQDPRMAALQMPFDGARMIFGGFVPISDVSR